MEVGSYVAVISPPRSSVYKVACSNTSVVLSSIIVRHIPYLKKVKALLDTRVKYAIFFANMDSISRLGGVSKRRIIICRRICAVVEVGLFLSVHPSLRPIINKFNVIFIPTCKGNQRLFETKEKRTWLYGVVLQVVRHLSLIGVQRFLLELSTIHVIANFILVVRSTRYLIWKKGYMVWGF